MILNPSDRRILTYPAVQPTRGISPATLLDYIVDIGQNILCYEPKLFTSNKRNVKETIRHIGTLLVCFEEFRHRNSLFSDSVVYILSELYVIFQKFLYLMEDGTREGSRLFMLMKSDIVADHYRVLFRSLGTVLGALPLHLIDVPFEVKEYIELVIRQVRFPRILIDRDDNVVIKDVMMIFRQFEDGVIPDRDRIKRVLDVIGIDRWSLCHKEVKFLDSEIEFHWSLKEDMEVSYLSDLMCLMSYSRCVLFDVVDLEADRKVDWCRSEMLSGCNPDDFRCPITLDFMVDPVVVASGHCYERDAIVKWFKAGNPICPKTGEKLKNKDLIPNLAFRSLIQKYCSANSIPFPKLSKRKVDRTRTVSAGSLKAEKIIRGLVKFLAGVLESGMAEEKKYKAALEIKLLSKASIYNRSCLVDIGLIPNLLKLLRSSDTLTQETVIGAVSNLSNHSKGRSVIMRNGGLEAIVYVLKKGLKVEARQLAAGTLFYISSVEEYRKRIGENKDAILALMDLLKGETDRAKKNAMVTLYGLLMHPGNHCKVLAAGAVPLLISLLKSDKENLITDSMAILASLADKPDGAAAIFHCGALSSFVGLLDSSSSKSRKEFCVSLLLALCINCGSEVTSNLVASHSLMPSLYGLIGEGTSRARKKASSLIRIIHQYTEEMLSNFDPIIRCHPQEQIVRAW